MTKCLIALGRNNNLYRSLQQCGIILLLNLLRMFSFMEAVGGVVNDDQQFGRHPPLHHLLLRGGQPRADNRTGSPAHFFHFVATLRLQLASLLPATEPNQQTFNVNGRETVRKFCSIRKFTYVNYFFPSKFASNCVRTYRLIKYGFFFFLKTSWQMLSLAVVDFRSLFSVKYLFVIIQEMTDVSRHRKRHRL